MANSVDPDETAHYEPSHLDLNCLQSHQYWSVGVKGFIYEQNSGTGSIIAETTFHEIAVSSGPQFEELQSTRIRSQELLQSGPHQAPNTKGKDRKNIIKQIQNEQMASTIGNSFHKRW